LPVEVSTVVKVLWEALEMDSNGLLVRVTLALVSAGSSIFIIKSPTCTVTDIFRLARVVKAIFFE
jgi:hypothetical protein